MPADKTANIFVLGLDEQNLDTLNRLPERERYAFHGLLTIPELQQGEIPIVELLTKAEQSLDEFDGTVDAVVGYWDFPVSTMLPLLCRSRGLPSASLEAVLKCEHKYWSRLEQRKVITEHPAFAVIDPDDDDPKPPADLRYPIWLKPVKSFSSELAFKVHDDAEFAEAMRQLEDGIGRVGDPFQFILDQADLPDEVAQVGARAVLAEESMSGVQAAVEGYARNGDVVVYGALDSVNFPDTDSFLRHQYPSQLPERAVDRMADVAKRVIEHSGWTTSCSPWSSSSTPRPTTCGCWKSTRGTRSRMPSCSRTSTASPTTSSWCCSAWARSPGYPTVAAATPWLPNGSTVTSTATPSCGALPPGTRSTASSGNWTVSKWRSWSTKATSSARWKVRIPTVVSSPSSSSAATRSTT